MNDLFWRFEQEFFLLFLWWRENSHVLYAVLSTVLVDIERHSWLERHETLFRHTVVIFDKSLSKTCSIWMKKMPKITNMRGLKLLKLNRMPAFYIHQYGKCLTFLAKKSIESGVYRLLNHRFLTITEKEQMHLTPPGCTFTVVDFR